MLKFVVGFKSKDELRNVWKDKFESGTVFLPTPKPFLIQTKVNVVLRILDQRIAAVIPARVIQHLKGGSPESTGMVVEYQNYENYKQKLKELIENPDDQFWQDLRNFNDDISEDQKQNISINQLPLSLQKLLKDIKLHANYYRTLGIDPTSSKKEIMDILNVLFDEFQIEKYLKKIRVEESGLLKEAQEKLQQIKETLTNRKKRLSYDLLIDSFVRWRDESKSDYEKKKLRFIQKKAMGKKKEVLEKAEAMIINAEEAENKGDLKTATTNMRIALAYDPRNKKFQKKLKELEEKLGNVPDPLNQKKVKALLDGEEKERLRDHKVDWTDD